VALRGRPPLPRSVLSFESPDWVAPEALLLDTSVVVEALLPSQPGHLPCVAFFERLAGSDCTVVFNELLETELCEVLFNIALKERHGKNWRKARYDGRVRRRAGRLLDAGLGAWNDLLNSLPWLSISLEEARPEAPGLMRRHGFQSYDAIHAATLFVANLRDFATLDHGFTAIPQSRLTIHTPSALVPTMRKRRAG